MSDQPNLPVTDEMPELWEYNPSWESYKQYQYFMDWFLSQDPPRSVIGAYRAFKAKEQKLDPKSEQILSLHKLPNNWRIMAFAVDRNNKRRDDGSKSWHERGDAYDAYMTRKVHVLTESRKVKSVLSALDQIDDMLAKWQEMFKVAKILRQTGVRELPVEIADPDDPRKTITIKKEIEIQALNVGQLRALIAAYEDLRDLQRRELGMPKDIHQTNVADHEGKEFSVLGRGFSESMSEALQDVQKWKREQAAAARAERAKKKKKADPDDDDSEE